MISLLIADRCTGCQVCVRVCPTNVFDSVRGRPPVIARPQDCQTCFLCELYCQPDALYVDPDGDAVVPVTVEQVEASGQRGTYRRDSGWHEWAGDPRYANEHWRMDQIFARARALS